MHIVHNLFHSSISMFLRLFPSVFERQKSFSRSKSVHEKVGKIIPILKDTIYNVIDNYYYPYNISVSNYSPMYQCFMW